MEQSQSLGESRVRTQFNPSSDSDVDIIKRKTAELIDLCEEFKRKGDKNPLHGGEVNRLFALAQTHYEDAAMWAVKALTI